MGVSGFTRKKSYLVMLLILFIIVLSAKFTFAQQVIRVSGSSTIQPILEDIRHFFEEKTGRKVELQGGGSSVGFRNAVSGISDIGTLSRSLSPAEKEQIKYTTIGMDALVVIVNARNPLAEASKQDVARLFKGEITNWQELGGHDQPVLLISKEVGRSTLELFEDYSGLKSPRREARGETGTISSDAFEIGSNLEGITLVGGIPGAVGYVSYGTAVTLLEMNMPIRILKLDGVDASVPNINNGTYPIVRELNVVYKDGNETALSFVETILSQEGQQAIEQKGFIPLR